MMNYEISDEIAMKLEIYCRYKEPLGVGVLEVEPVDAGPTIYD